MESGDKLFVEQYAMQNLEAHARIGEFEHLLLDNLADGQDLGDAEADPAGIVETHLAFEVGIAYPRQNFAQEIAALRELRAGGILVIGDGDDLSGDEPGLGHAPL